MRHPRRLPPFALLPLAFVAGLTLARAPRRAAAGADGDRPPASMQPLLDAHNRLRARHCAPPLVWASEVARVAQRWADQLAARGCAFQHSGSRTYGENLAGGTAGSMTASDVAELWYKEERAFDFRSGGFSMKTGHFTQLAWVATRRLGCGTATCKNGMQLWVCNYDPPGNVISQNPY
jgi:pathogenesis-related protein 1